MVLLAARQRWGIGGRDALRRIVGVVGLALTVGCGGAQVGGAASAGGARAGDSVAPPIVASPVAPSVAPPKRTLAQRFPLPLVLEDDGDASNGRVEDGLDGAWARVFLRTNPGPFQYVAYEITARGRAGVVSHLRGMMGRRDAVIRTELISRQRLAEIFARLEAAGASSLPPAPPLVAVAKTKAKPRRGSAAAAADDEDAAALPTQSARPIYEFSYRRGKVSHTVRVVDPMAASSGHYARFLAIVRAEVRGTVGDIGYHSPDAEAGASGYLFIDSVPSADVFVDGEALPERTPVLNWTLAPGIHDVRLRRDDLQIDRTYKVRIEPGLTASLEVDLR